MPTLKRKSKSIAQSDFGFWVPQYRSQSLSAGHVQLRGHFWDRISYDSLPEDLMNQGKLHGYSRFGLPNSIGP